MYGYGRKIAILLAIAALTTAGCARSLVEGAEPTEAAAVTVQDGPNPEEKIVTLSERAAERLGVRTAPIAADKGTTAVPYAAILYDTHGQAWVYEQSRPLTFMRVPVEIQAIAGDDVRLTAGPPVGTLVVTVGVAELFGAETGVGEPE